MKKTAVAAVIILFVMVALSLGLFRRTAFNYSGVVEAVEVDVPARLSDVIIKITAEEGSAVKRGDILAELECKATALQYDIAKKEFERAANLLKASAGSQENYDLRKNQYDAAALAKSWCLVPSPLDGKVLYKYYEEGEFAGAGRKIFTVADLKEIDAWVYVEHDLIAKLSTGQKVNGRLPETGGDFEGVILTISDEAEFTPKNVQTRKERQRLVFGVKTRFKNDAVGTLKPGMTLEVTF
jgi:HlyD family secretion protein